MEESAFLFLSNVSGLKVIILDALPLFSYKIREQWA